MFYVKFATILRSYVLSGAKPPDYLCFKCAAHTHTLPCTPLMSGLQKCIKSPLPWYGHNTGGMQFYLMQSIFVQHSTYTGYSVCIAHACGGFKNLQKLNAQEEPSSGNIVCTGGIFIFNGQVEGKTEAVSIDCSDV